MESESVALHQNYCHWRSYKLSKVSNILFARELHRRYAEQGVIAVSLNPGVVVLSGIARNIRYRFSDLSHIINYMLPAFQMDNLKTMSQGAATTLRCVSLSDDEIRGGGYYHNCQFEEITGAAMVRKYEDYNTDSLETKLWKLTETLIQFIGPISREIP